jgi:hypothetical protein
LNGEGIMIVPQAFDMNLVRLKYRFKQVRRSPLSNGIIFFRNPNGLPALLPDPDVPVRYF